MFKRVLLAVGNLFAEPKPGFAVRVGDVDVYTTDDPTNAGFAVAAWKAKVYAERYGCRAVIVDRRSDKTVGETDDRGFFPDFPSAKNIVKFQPVAAAS